MVASGFDLLILGPWDLARKKLEVHTVCRGMRQFLLLLVRAEHL